MLDWEGDSDNAELSCDCSLDGQRAADDDYPPVHLITKGISPSVVGARVSIGTHLDPSQSKGMTVVGRVRSITGADPTQSALIVLRNGLFKNILPALSRKDKRKKDATIATIEQHRCEILPLLDTPAAIDAVLKVALDELKRTAHRNEVLMKRYGIH